jgi:hypothetical protein
MDLFENVGAVSHENFHCMNSKVFFSVSCNVFMFKKLSNILFSDDQVTASGTPTCITDASTFS